VFVGMNIVKDVCYLTVVVGLVELLLSSTTAAGAFAAEAGDIVAEGCDTVTGSDSDSDMETVRNSAFDMFRMGTPCGLTQANESE
jgi:hypothetical protein